jgi:hypothetical protein
MKRTALRANACKLQGVASRAVRNAWCAMALVPFVPGIAEAQPATGAESGRWTYAVALNLYVPTLSGSTRFPADSGGTPIEVDAGQILDRLKALFMGSFEATNGAWGFATDIVYVHFGNATSNTREFSIGNAGVPAGTSANLDWNLRASAWTTAATYRVASEPSISADALAGVRLLDLRQNLSWNISGNLGALPPSSRTGSAEANQNLWDVIVGVKGRYRFGSDRRWVAPFYVDVGAGESAGTAQLAAGIGYSFGWGEANAMWRYLHYRFKSGSAASDVTLSGPQFGVVFRW